jgi:hypothetical protein
MVHGSWFMVHGSWLRSKAGLGFVLTAENAEDGAEVAKVHQCSVLCALCSAL